MLPPDRIANFAPEALGSLPVCARCDNTGLIEQPIPAWPGSEGTGQAPCPNCALGFRIEFGIGAKRDGRGEKVVDWWWPNPRGGPWGRDGYWQGRDSQGVPRDTRVT